MEIGKVDLTLFKKVESSIPVNNTVQAEKLKISVPVTKVGDPSSSQNLKNSAEDQPGRRSAAIATAGLVQISSSLKSLSQQIQELQDAVASQVTKQQQAIADAATASFESAIKSIADSLALNVQDKAKMQDALGGTREAIAQAATTLTGSNPKDNQQISSSVALLEQSKTASTEIRNEIDARISALKYVETAATDPSFKPTTNVGASSPEITDRGDTLGKALRKNASATLAAQSAPPADRFIGLVSPASPNAKTGPSTESTPKPAAPTVEQILGSSASPSQLERLGEVKRGLFVKN